MNTSWRIFRRDLARLARVSKTWIIVIGITIIPALYAWININAFWDPYSQTGAIKVAVANSDRGTTSELTGHINVGDAVIEQLRTNDQLGWEFMSEDSAQHAVHAGTVHAAIIINASFSSDLLSIATGTFTQPTLTYLVNEKSSAIAPKITDVAASTLDTQITAAFLEQVGQAATEALSAAGKDLQDELATAQSSTGSSLTQTAQSLRQAQDDITQVTQKITASSQSVAAASNTLGSLQQAMSDLQTIASLIQTTSLKAQEGIANVTFTMSSAATQGSTALAGRTSNARADLAELGQELSNASTRIDGANRDAQAALASTADTLALLNDLTSSSPLAPEVKDLLTQGITQLEERTNNQRRFVDELTALKRDVDLTAGTFSNSLDTLNTTAQSTSTNTAAFDDTLRNALPRLNMSITHLAGSVGGFTASLDAHKATITATQDLLRGINAQLDASMKALSSLKSNLADVEITVNSIRTDVLALDAATQLNALTTISGLDAERIAHFIGSPVQVDGHAIFPVGTYGSAMSALFTNLSLWIGAFVLVVIFRTEVDTEGLGAVSVHQAYIGRFFLFAVLTTMQALVVSIGNLVIGVQSVSPVGMVATSVLIALAYLSIIYALSVALGHVGLGVAILLVIMQIPGASGLYPIELMPGFFRALAPLLPFSYGINAMRETIAGFQGTTYWQCMSALALMTFIAFVVGITLRRRLASFTRLFNKEVTATGLLVGETIDIDDHSYRLSDLIRALRNRERYRESVDERARPFTERYPQLVRTILAIGISGLVFLAIMATLLHESKALLLGLWSLWCLLLMGALVTVEYIKHSFEQAYALAARSSEEIGAQLDRRSAFKDEVSAVAGVLGSLPSSSAGSDDAAEGLSELDEANAGAKFSEPVTASASALDGDALQGQAPAGDAPQLDATQADEEQTDEAQGNTGRDNTTQPPSSDPLSTTGDAAATSSGAPTISDAQLAPNTDTDTDTEAATQEDK